MSMRQNHVPALLSIEILANHMATDIVGSLTNGQHLVFVSYKDTKWNLPKTSIFNLRIPGCGQWPADQTTKWLHFVSRGSISSLIEQKEKGICLAG